MQIIVFVSYRIKRERRILEVHRSVSQEIFVFSPKVSFFLTDMSEPKVIVADDGDQVSLKLKDLIQGEADKVLKSSDTATLVIGLSGSMSS